jgi:hypothetical protein
MRGASICQRSEASLDFADETFAVACQRSRRVKPAQHFQRAGKAITGCVAGQRQFVETEDDVKLPFGIVRIGG